MDEDPLPPIHPVLNIRPKAPKLCGVCGDISKSQHFGAISCDSCKAFFKRTVHAQNYPHLKCSEKGDCEVQISTRKNCQHCRFKKCLSTGMEISWVMTEEQRKEFNKEMELKKKLKELNKMDFQDETSTSDDSTFNDDFYIPTMENIRLFMTENEESFVKSLVLKYTYSYKKVPYEKNLSSDNDGRPNIQTVDMFTTIIRRFAYFSMLLPEFSNLPRSDQSILLKSGILEMCLLRSALCFDIEKNRWPNTNWDLYADAPTLQLEDMQRLVTPELYEMHLDFIQSMQEMGLDEATCMLILGITLLTPDRPGLTEKAKVSQGQDKFIDHLEKYVRWRYGPTRGPIIFPKLVTKLADLRELSDSHNEYNLRLAKEEVNVIKKSLASLNLEEDNDLMTQAISSPIVATSPANTIKENHGYETSPEIHPNLQQEQEMEGRKQLMTIIQKSLIQILNNSDVMDIEYPIEDSNWNQDLKLCQNNESISVLQNTNQKENNNHTFHSLHEPNNFYVENPSLDSNIKVLDDHRVRVEVHCSSKQAQSEPSWQIGSQNGSTISIGADNKTYIYNQIQGEDVISPTLTLDQVSQLKSTMEQLLQCNDPRQLELVKQVVGHELLQQVQTKLDTNVQYGQAQEYQSIEEEHFVSIGNYAVNF